MPLNESDMMDKLYYNMQDALFATRLNTPEYLRMWGDSLGVPKKRSKGGHRRYTFKEIQIIKDALEVSKKYSKMELVAMFVKSR